MANNTNVSATHGVNSAELKAALDRMNDREHPSSHNRRGKIRLSYHRPGVPVKIVHPAGKAHDTVMSADNLSPDGIRLIHSAFLHTGTQMRITLRRRLGGPDVIAGTVAWCLHLVRSLHAVGVRFERLIDVKHFLDAEEYSDLRGGGTTPADLKGRVLLLDDQEMDRMLFVHYMKATNCEVVAVPSIPEAVKAMTAKPVDVVLCDLNLDDVKGEEAIARFRSAGFKGPIVAVTAETDPERRSAARSAGATDVLNKPYDSTTLLNRMADWLQSLQPIYSSLVGQPDAEMLIEQYVKQIATLIKDLETALVAEDFAHARRVCQTVKGTAPGFGFATLYESASNAVRALDASQSVAESKNEIQFLAAVCHRVRFTPPDAAPQESLRTKAPKLV